MRFFLLYVGIIYPSGELISPHLLRYSDLPPINVTPLEREYSA
jgi:hypothetical protein